jgi:hypothetical protein
MGRFLSIARRIARVKITQAGRWALTEWPELAHNLPPTNPQG